MNVSEKVLKSRFARRVSLLFVLAALIPVAVGALAAYRHVAGNLGEASFARLQDDARVYGLALADKLVMADEMLGSLAARAGNPGASPADRQGLERWFSSVSVATSDGRLDTLSGSRIGFDQLPRNVRETITSGRSAIFAIKDKDARSRLLLLRPDSAGNSPRTYLVAQLDREFLRGDAESRNTGVDFCMAGASGIAVNCPATVPADVTARLGQPDENGELNGLRWASGDVRFRGSAWRLPLDARFDGEQFSILALQPRADAFAALTGFAGLYLVIFALAAVLAASLSLYLVRRSLRPVAKLEWATHRIARRQFPTNIQVSSDDEFEELAESMNEMSQQLCKQFKTLDMLAKVDQLILSSTGVEPVLEIVLADIGNIIACDFVSVGLIDEDSGEHLRVHVSDLSRQGKSSIVREGLTLDQRSFLNGMGPIEEFSGVAPDFEFIEPLFEAGAKRAAVFSIQRGHEAVGFIGLGYRDGAAPDTEELQPVRDFADRIAIALAASEHDEHLYQQAHFDVLTGLPNRQLFMDRLGQEIAHARRENRLGALMFIDLDNFKRINDSLGHTIGDELLCAAAKRLEKCVRDADTVARLGGDEFTIIISGINTAATASTIADSVLKAFARPFFLGKVEHFVTASIGITLFPDDGVDPEVLLQNADTAMYRAKSEGRARKAFFEESMHALAVRRLQVEAELRKALKQGDQFRLEYQPQIGLADGQVSGVEALVRWHHPEYGLIPPDEFVAVAEETGLIYDIGLWVLRNAATQFKAWQAQRLDIGRILVNVSTRQFQGSEFASDVRSILLETGLRTTELELEITESLVGDERPEVVQTLHDLHCMGVNFVIDDFGAGSTSLSQLRRFNYDKLKIDRGFIVGLPDQADATGITTAIVRMAHTLGKRVVAEGIEDEEQLAFLKSIGCDYVQGYYFSHPLDSAGLVEFVHGIEIEPLFFGHSQQKLA